MNHHLHSIVFNAARGVRMVVWEAAASMGDPIKMVMVTGRCRGPRSYAAQRDIGERAYNNIDTRRSSAHPFTPRHLPGCNRFDASCIDHHPGPPYLGKV